MADFLKSDNKILNFSARYGRRYMAVFTGLAISAIGIAMLAGSIAAGPFVAAQPESGTITAPAAQINDATASGNSAVKFDVATGVPPVPQYGWQLTATNTGLARFGLTCANLPAYTGPGKIPAGTNITGVRFTYPIDLHYGNINIDKSCWRIADPPRGRPVASTTDYDLCTNDCPAGLGPVTISNSEFDGSLGTVEEQAFSVGVHGLASLVNNYFHHLGGGIATYNSGVQFSSVISGNYVTKMIPFGDPATTGNHLDAYTVRDFQTSANPSRTLVVKGNRFDCDAPSNCTGAFFIQAMSYINNVTVQDNLLDGGGYNLALETHWDTYGNNIRSINNRLGGASNYLRYVNGGPGWAEWTNNYQNDPTKVDNKGAVVTEP